MREFKKDVDSEVNYVKIVYIREAGVPEDP